MTQPPDIDRIINLRLSAGTIRRVLTPVVFLIFLLQHPPVWPAPCSNVEGSPCKTVRDATEEVLAILQNSKSETKPKYQEKLKRIWFVMLAHVDPCEIAMLSLPPDYLPQMSKSQKEEFTDIYNRLLVQAHSIALDRPRKDRTFHVTYDEENIEANHALVKSRLVTSSTETTISYSLRQEGEKWLIYDISYDGLSQVESYRAQLERVGKKFAYDYGEVRRLIKERLRPGLKELPVPQVKMRLWGICQR